MWQAPLWMHVAALAAALCVALWVSSPLVAHSSDEGAAILQARLLEHTGSWILPSPTQVLDPAGAALPILRADSGPKGRAPYAKHPLYPLVLTGFWEVFGDVGYWLSSLLGTLFAAVLGARIARRMDPVTERPVLWAIGFGTPLLFDATWVLAHSLAAAAVTAAALLLLEGLNPDDVRSVVRSSLVALGAGAATAMATGIRSEAALAGFALGVAGLSWCALRRSARGAVTAGAILCSVGGTWLVERLARHRILGGAVGGPRVGVQGSVGQPWVMARWHAVQVTLLRPTYYPSRNGILLVTGALALAAAAFAARRRSVVLVVACEVAGVCAYAAVLVASSPQDVPGLLIACPLVGAGLLCVRRPPHLTPAFFVASTAAVLTFLAVVATEYSIGGGVEWGGRYFAAVLPLVVVGLSQGFVLLPKPWRGTLVAGVAATSLVVGLLSVGSAREHHLRVQHLSSELSTCARTAGSSGTAHLDRRPLILSTLRLLPQLDWTRYDDYLWVTPPPGMVNQYARRSADVGVQRLVGVTEGALDLDGSGFEVVHTCRSRYVTMSVLGRLQAAGGAAAQ